MLGTSIVMGASNLEDLLRGLVQARTRTLGLDEIVVADHGEDRGRLVAGMDREVHVLRDRHGLVAAHQRPFHEVVALAVAIEPQSSWLAAMSAQDAPGLSRRKVWACASFIDSKPSISSFDALPSTMVRAISV